LREVTVLVQQYLGLRISMVTLATEERSSDVRLSLHASVPLGSMQAFVVEAVLFSIKNVLEDTSLGRCQITQLAFPFGDRGYAGLAETLLSCPVHYAQDWAGLTIPRQQMDLPLKRWDPRAFHEARELCRRQLASIEADLSCAARVQRVLLASRVGLPSQQEAARRLGLSTRTLHRRLRDEGTSFRTVLEDVRRSLAVQHLSLGTRIEEVAYLLGYSDVANFRRAFKRWVGVPPSRFRPDGRRTGGK
ncbi:MAG: helix-turn-helix domain-containing protein, partial [Myxococcota bacterium]